MTLATLDPERQERAREYARIRRRLWAGEAAGAGAYLALWIALGWGIRLRQAIVAVSAGGIPPFQLPWWAVMLLVAAALAVPWFVLTLPVDLYAGFVLPRRYQLSTQSLAGWLSDLVKGGLLSLALGTPVLLGLYLALRLAPRTWWLWAGGGDALFTAILALLGPILILPIFNKFVPLGDDHADLRQRLIGLANSAGTRVEGVYQSDMSRRTRAANAALAGLGRTRRILIGDTLLSEFTPDEIETVLAHELAHHVHKDIPLSLLAQALSIFVSFYLASIVLQWSVARLTLAGPGDPAGLPLLGLLLGAMELASLPLANAFSRWRESLADDFALRLTRKPEAFASAMARLANQNLADADPEPWVVFLLHSHPPLRARIEKARAFRP